MSDKPNVLFIMTDQHNAKYLSCAGHPHAQTPNLDRLAAEGVRFTASIPQNSICTPSRISHLSGQYCHNHGHYALIGPRPDGLPTVLGHFRRSGYRTAFVGKSHGPEYWIEDDCDVFHDTTNCAIGGRSAEYVQYLDQRGVNILSDFTDGDNRPSTIAFEDGEEGWGARKCIEVMAQAKSDDQPLFMTFWPPKPHGPYTPAQEFWDLYDPDTLTLAPNASYDLEAAHKSPLLRSVVEWVRRESDDFEGDRMRKLRGYLGNVSHVDFAIGQVMDFLDESGLADNTIVVYSADHGEYAGEHGPNEKVPGICADAVTHVPMIWRWPDHFKTGHVAADVVETVDISTTLCALAGLEPMQTADGLDISHMLAGKPGDPERLGVTEYALSKSVRKGKWRMVYYPRGYFEGMGTDPFGELYDLDADPWEMKNLFFDPQYDAVIRRLERELMDWMMLKTRPATLQAAVDISGPQVTTRYTLPVNADGKVPTSVYRKNFPGPPHL